MGAEAGDRLPYELYPLGESAVVIRWPGEAGESILQRLDRAVRLLEAAAPPWVTEWVRAYTSLTVFYDPWLVYHEGASGSTGVSPPKEGLGRPRLPEAKAWSEGASLKAAGRPAEEAEYNGSGAVRETDGSPFERVCGWMRQMLQELDQEGEAGAEVGRLLVIPACFGGPAGPDLSGVAARAGLSPEEAVTLYCSAVYTVHLIGFLPGFPYLGGLPPRLESPRLAQPRTVVPAGSIGIAGRQTGVYPVDSPGGWQLIGRTPLRLFDAEHTPPALLQPGDRVRFEAVSAETCAELEREQ
ncbi:MULTISPECIES: 5-oxoprolinase subunit PxpB [Paenibacillus]|uniref:5-oxoprolinase subunit PxpB n=1 Tax=Paenibacillus TaxID=44249 RepID=UPI0022B92297|nr:5-oxoprolinase subunit PxpB [Paenibacillus caseinilyticus]MCZ8523652.1 5-oxoprolinase subunit PxpB [Paenibacillus caseinilyticus]